MKAMKAKLVNFDINDNWCSGVVGTTVEFWAKVFDESSEFGIDGGRVSKLSIVIDGELAINYDRGWDIKPAKSNIEKYNAVITLLEMSPKRFSE